MYTFPSKPLCSLLRFSTSSGVCGVYLINSKSFPVSQKTQAPATTAKVPTIRRFINGGEDISVKFGERKDLRARHVTISIGYSILSICNWCSGYHYCVFFYGNLHLLLYRFTFTVPCRKALGIGAKNEKKYNVNPSNI